MWTWSGHREGPGHRLAAAAGSHIRLWQPCVSGEPGAGQGQGQGQAQAITVPLSSTGREEVYSWFAGRGVV